MRERQMRTVIRFLCIWILFAIMVLPGLVEDGNLTIYYVDVDGTEKSFNCDNTQFKNDPERVDTIVLAENFQLPVCNYQQNDIKFSIRLQCSITARETSSYSREMYLDCIYLRPRRN